MADVLAHRDQVIDEGCNSCNCATAMGSCSIVFQMALKSHFVGYVQV
jgi:hypothetical protein